MIAVATGTVGDADITEARSRSMIRVGIGLISSGKQTILAGNSLVIVTARANTGYSGGINRGPAVKGTQNVVFLMAIRTNRDIFDSFNVIFAMNPFQIISFDSHMALTTGMDDFSTGGPGVRVFGGQNIVAAMTMAAISGKS